MKLYPPALFVQKVTVIPVKRQTVCVLLSVFCLLLLSACASAEAENADPTVTLDLRNSGQCRETPVTLIDGVVQPGIPDVIQPLALPEDGITLELDRKTELVVDRMEYGFAEGIRLTGAYADSSALGTQGSVSFECRTECVSDVDQKLMDRAVRTVIEYFGLAETGSSALASTPFLAVPEEGGRFSAVFFYPRILTVYGTITTDAEPVYIRVDLPCAAPQGVLDGVYALQTYDRAEDVPDTLKDFPESN